MAGSGLTFNIYGQDVSASQALQGVEHQAEDSGESISGSFKKVAEAIGAAFVLDKAKDFFVDAVKEASDAQQSIGATQLIFGKYSQTIIDDSQKAAEKYGLSANEFREQSNLIASLFKNQGISADKLAGKTENMIGVASDLAATFGGTTSEAVEALSSAFKGEFDSLERYGVSIKQSTIDAYLAAKGQKNLTGAAAAAAQQQAVTAIIMKQAGSAQGAFAAQTGTLAEQQQILSAKMSNLKVEIGDALIPVITSLTQFLTDKVVPAFSATIKWAKENKKWLVPLAEAIGGVWVAWKGYTIAKSAATAVSGAVRTLGADITALKAKTVAATTATGGFIKRYGVAAGVIGGVAVAGYAAGKAISNWTEHGQTGIATINNLKNVTEGFTQALVASNGAIDKNVRMAVAKKLQDAGLADKAHAAGISLGQLTDAVIGGDKATQELIKTWKAQGKPSNDTLLTLTALTMGYDKAAGNQKSLTAASKDATKEQKTGIRVSVDAAAANAENARNTKKAADALAAEKKAAAENKKELDKLKSSILNLGGSQLQLSQAQDDFKASLDTLTQSVKDNGHSLSSNTEKGRANRDNLRASLQSALDWAQGQDKAGVSIDKVTKKLESNVKQLIKTADGAGFSKAQVQKLVREMHLTPSQIETTFKSNATKAMKEIAALNRDVVKLDGKTIHINTDVGTMLAAHLGSRSGYRPHAQGVGFTSRAARSIVGEYGPEILDLPRGSRVTSMTSAVSQLRMAGGAPTVVQINLPGQVYATEAQIGRAVGAALEHAVAGGVRLNISRGVV